MAGAAVLDSTISIHLLQQVNSTFCSEFNFSSPNYCPAPRAAHAYCYIGRTVPKELRLPAMHIDLQGLKRCSAIWTSLRCQRLAHEAKLFSMQWRDGCRLESGAPGSPQRPFLYVIYTRIAHSIYHIITCTKILTYFRMHAMPTMGSAACFAFKSVRKL